MWREAAILVAIGALCSIVGAAASLTLSPGSLGAAQLPVPRCTNGGILVLQNLSGANVASVTVSGLQAACGNAAAQVTVNNGSVNSSGSATVPGAGGAVTVNMAVPPPATTTEQTELLLTGP